jgi:hypothetical protein
MADSKPIIFIQPLSKALSQLIGEIEEIKNSENLQIFEMNSFLEIDQAFPALGSSFTIVSSPKKCAILLTTHKAYIKNNKCKIILLSPKPIPSKIIKRLVKLGLTECIVEPVPAKTLFYKAKIHIKAINILKTTTKEKDAVLTKSRDEMNLGGLEEQKLKSIEQQTLEVKQKNIRIEIPKRDQNVDKNDPRNVEQNKISAKMLEDLRSMKDELNIDDSLEADFSNVIESSSTADKLDGNLDGKSNYKEEKVSDMFGKNSAADKLDGNLNGKSNYKEEKSSDMLGKNSAADKLSSNLIGKSNYKEEKISDMFGKNSAADKLSSNLIRKSNYKEEKVSDMFGKNSAADNIDGQMSGKSSTTDKKKENPIDKLRREKREAESKRKEDQLLKTHRKADYTNQEEQVEREALKADYTQQLETLKQKATKDELDEPDIEDLDTLKLEVEEIVTKSKESSDQLPIIEKDIETKEIEKNSKEREPIDKEHESYAEKDKLNNQENDLGYSLKSISKNNNGCGDETPEDLYKTTGNIKYSKDGKRGEQTIRYDQLNKENDAITSEKESKKSTGTIEDNTESTKETIIKEYSPKSQLQKTTNSVRARHESITEAPRIIEAKPNGLDKLIDIYSLYCDETKDFKDIYKHIYKYLCQISPAKVIFSQSIYKKEKEFVYSSGFTDHEMKDLINLNKTKWKEIGLPTWHNESFETEKNSLLFPYYSGITSLGYVYVEFTEQIKKEHVKQVEVTLEGARGIFLEYFDKNDITEKKRHLSLNPFKKVS